MSLLTSICHTSSSAPDLFPSSLINQTQLGSRLLLHMEERGRQFLTSPCANSSISQLHRTRNKEALDRGESYLKDLPGAPCQSCVGYTLFQPSTVLQTSCSLPQSLLLWLLCQCHALGKMTQKGKTLYGTSYPCISHVIFGNSLAFWPCSHGFATTLKVSHHLEQGKRHFILMTHHRTVSKSQLLALQCSWLPNYEGFST